VTTLASRAQTATQFPIAPRVRDAATSAAWIAALAVGLMWPARSLSLVDGVPLDGRTEAIVVGLGVPTLLWFDASFLRRPIARWLIGAMLALKIAGFLLPQEGLCARFSTPAPLVGAVLTMPIDEPRGMLRSWDVRADWRGDDPACTAILDRPYRSAAEFPAWFVNILDHLRGRRDVAMAVRGALNVSTPGVFTIRLGENMRLRGRVGDAGVASAGGADVTTSLAAGTYALALDVAMTGERWRFEPLWNGEPAWGSGRLALTGMSASARLFGRILAVLTTVTVTALIGLWTIAALLGVHPGSATMAFATVATTAAVAVAATGRFERAAGVLALAATIVPVAAPQRRLRTVFLLVGLPWLAFFAVRALPLVGHVTAYSWDDWLAYQLAASRIYMHGYWLEAGTKTFDYQALYRWINGALHVVFGDSSVGETYLDAAALLTGALLAYALVRPLAGFRIGVLAAAATLATFLLGTPWYFVGRGLSEIAAAGLAFSTAFLLLRARLGRLHIAALAGVCGVLTFYARVNHLLFVLSLLALLLPLATPTEPRALVAALHRVRLGAASVYAAAIALGVALFAARTWWYTGVFSVLYGTSLKNNDTGLRLATIATAAPWRKVVHSLSALVWMNEPPRPDPRSLLVVGGVAAAIGALLQVPRLRQLPAGIVAGVIGSTLSSFLAHTHGYPGRMSIHLIPFAVSAAMIAAVRLVRPTPPAVAR